MTRGRDMRPAGRNHMVRLLLARWLRGAVRFARDQRGIAAIEFALVGPVAVFGLVAMADIGLAVRDRMALDHIVRTGAQAATTNPGAEAVLDALNTAAQGGLTRAGSAAALSVSVARECACHDTPEVTVACATSCSGQKPTFIFYTLRAETVASGLILPNMAVASRARVQIR